MNDKVYYVRGGMEDWAFAGSWDPDRVVTCTPTTFNGYSPDKTRYNNSTLRAFNMLIETSDPKEPPRTELGTRNDPLISTNDNNNGHVARNIRLALLAIDVVEPYVSIRGVEGWTGHWATLQHRGERRGCELFRTVAHDQRWSMR